MSEIFNFEAWRQVIVTSVTELGRTLAGFLPSLVGMLVILGVGWCIAKLVEAVSRRVLDRVGLDRTSERLGVADTLRDAGILRGPSQLIARLLFWLLMLTFLLSAFETLGLTAVTATIDRVIAYLPNVIAASLIVIVGLLIARFAGNLVSSGAAAANVTYARGLGSAARGILIVMIAILATEQLGIATQVLVTAVTAAVAAFTAGLALAFALGSREVVRAILAGHYLRQSLSEGQIVEVAGRRGTLERVGPTDTLFREEDGTWSVPNSELLETVVIRPAGVSK
jgi:hypothetical protein